jgi:hypothetical protein
MVCVCKVYDEPFGTVKVGDCFDKLSSYQIFTDDPVPWS